jgi:hypothetical protein
VAQRFTDVLPLPLGGAAVYRCDNCIVLNAALAAEVTSSAGNDFFRSLFSRAVSLNFSYRLQPPRECKFQTESLPSWKSHLKAIAFLL